MLASRIWPSQRQNSKGPGVVTQCHHIQAVERYGAATGRELRSWIGQPWFANRISINGYCTVAASGPKLRELIDVALLLDPAEARV